MKPIEAMLIEKGATKKELDSFTGKDNHNGKPDEFVKIFGSINLENLKRYSNGNFLSILAETFYEIGIDEKNRLHIKISDGQKKFVDGHGRGEAYKLLVAGNVALEMMKTCEGYRMADRTITLNQIYQDTISRLEEKK